MGRAIQAACTVLLASTLATAAACGSSASRLEGVYTITSVDGAPLPARWVEDTELIDGGVMLKDGRYVAMLDLAAAGESEPLRLRDGGAFRVRGGALEFQTDQAAGGAVANLLPVAVTLSKGRMEGESLILHLRGHEVRLARMQK